MCSSDLIDTALSRLVEIARLDDPQKIKSQVEALEKQCEFYVERRMNRSVRNAMQGHSVGEFE